MTPGKLVVSKKTLQVEFTNAKGKLVCFNIKESELSAPLAQKKKTEIAQLNGLEVELEEVAGQPTKIREKGKAFESPQSINSTSKSDMTKSTVTTSTFSHSSVTKPPGEFHNPYNFVPALPRNTERVQNSELGDRAPSGHDSYQDDLWSGKISVTLTTVTPLLIPDAANAEGKEHKTYPMRLGLDGKPYLPPTSIKGMLRTAYEAVTNSRLSVFEKHEDRLFYRMNAGDGLSLVPARFEGNEVKLLFGTTSDIPKWNGKRWQIPNNQPMYAAWLPRYRNRHGTCHNLRYHGMTHGDRVKVWLELYQKQDKNRRVIFTYWLVREIVPFEQSLGAQPAKGKTYGSHVPAGQPMIKTDGYVCITNRNIENKHDERVFFCYNSTTQHKETFAHLCKDWEYLINNYQEIHAGQARENNLEWSRHVLGGQNEQNLTNGTLCYAYVVKNTKGNYEVKCLYPVMISRAIFDLSPDTLLSPDSKDKNEKDLLRLKLAENLKDLSPADRVFGWVNQNGKGSYKGQLRIISVKCESDDAVQQFDKEPFPTGLPLAILGEPKPQQVRFYVAETPKGEPLPNRTKKAEGYREGQGLRGRKVYPHHQLPNDYWNTDSDTIKIDNQYREYLRPDKKQDNQNRTITGWVKPETKFTFDIDVINLSNVELGALLWLLDLSDKYPRHFHRLGGGKPLGFGSVKLKIQQTDLRTGKQWREFYRSLTEAIKPEQSEVINSIKDFEKAVKDAYNADFMAVSFIAAFLQVAKGFDKPIHYPRTSKEPNAEGESFQWFVENEKLPNPNSLNFLVNDPGLPILKP
jgi:CRISPR-associated protein (TIGR03986 family)